MTDSLISYGIQCRNHFFFLGYIFNLEFNEILDSYWVFPLFLIPYSCILYHGIMWSVHIILIYCRAMDRALNFDDDVDDGDFF